MSTAEKKHYTVEEYLEIDRRSPVKCEYYQGEIFAMAGASPDHNVIAANVIGELRNRLKGGPCVPYAGDLRVKVDRTELYAYPDATVICGQPNYDEEDRITVLNPTLVVEVLSDSTEKYDRGTKRRHYAEIESLKEYLIIDQHEAKVELHIRQPDGSLTRSDFVGLEAVVPLASVKCELPLAEIYYNVVIYQPGRHPGPPPE